MSHQLSAYSGHVPMAVDASDENSLSSSSTVRDALESGPHCRDNVINGEVSPENESNESTAKNPLANGNNDMPPGSESNGNVDLKVQGDDLNGMEISGSAEEESKMEE